MSSKALWSALVVTSLSVSCARPEPAAKPTTMDEALDRNGPAPRPKPPEPAPAPPVEKGPLFRFDEPIVFRGQRARVRVDGNFGFLAPDGRMAIAPTYTKAGEFVSAYAGLCLVSKDPDGTSNLGLIDKDGRTVLPFK